MKECDMVEWNIKTTSNYCNFLQNVHKGNLNQCYHFDNPSACCCSKKCPIKIKESKRGRS